jgi:hypothetical protein
MRYDSILRYDSIRFEWNGIKCITAEIQSHADGLALLEQFRAEIFNLLNWANFNTPNLIVFTPSGVSATAGAMTSTSTTSRQVQFAVKLLW